MRTHLKGRIACVVFLMGTMATAPAIADINVGLVAQDSVVPLGGTVDVDIVADIPEADAIVGWGLDLTIDDLAIASQVGAPVIGPLWDVVSTPDGDGLAGLVFPDGVFGPAVLLATVTLSGDALGSSDLILSDDNPTDLTEGFALDEGRTGFATVVYTPGSITVIPEPATLALLAIGVVAVRRRRR